MKKGYTIGAVLSYLCSIGWIIFGFYKINVYHNDALLSSSDKNVYVNGDAYNYIINANYASAYFTLAVFFAIIGTTFIIAYLLNKNNTNNNTN